MGAGRPKLTQREKLKNKLVKLQKEAKTILTLLAGKFSDEVAEAETLKE